jgi:hypothetical protein
MPAGAESDPLVIDVYDRLWQSIYRLTEPAFEVMTRDSGSLERVRAAPLLDQLAEALVPSGEVGSGGTGKSKSKPPLAIDALDLRAEIRKFCRLTISGDIASALKARAKQLERHRDTAAAWSMVDQLDDWAERIRAVCGQAELTTRSLPIECPSCGERWCYVEQDGETIRQDTIAATFDGGVLESFACKQCRGVWRRGADLDALVDWMLTAA